MGTEIAFPFPFFKGIDMMNLKDKRLLACAELCTGDVVCDIGTDHGYLPAYLVETGKCVRAVAADINSMPLDAARHTFAKCGLSDKAEFFLSDGLLGVDLEGVTDIVIAGMGGELIASILEADERVKACNAAFILQPMTRASVLRKYLAENGFDIETERGISEGRFVYSVIKCRYSGRARDIGAVEENVGTLSADKEEDRLYMLKAVERIERAAAGMQDNKPERAAELSATAQLIRREKGL